MIPFRARSDDSCGLQRSTSSLLAETPFDRAEATVILLPVQKGFLLCPDVPDSSVAVLAMVCAPSVYHMLQYGCGIVQFDDHHRDTIEAFVALRGDDSEPEVKPASIISHTTFFINGAYAVCNFSSSYRPLDPDERAASLAVAIPSVLSCALHMAHYGAIRAADTKACMGALANGTVTFNSFLFSDAAPAVFLPRADLSIEELCASLPPGDRTQPRWNCPKRAVFFGKTEAGKSTTANVMCGVPLEAYVGDDQTTRYRVVAGHMGAFDIGALQQGSIGSCTKVMKSVEHPSGTFTIDDLPGDEDTVWKDRITNNVVKHRALHPAHGGSFVPIVPLLTIGYTKTVTVTNGDALRAALEAFVLSVHGDTSDNHEQLYLRNVVTLLTHVPDDMSDEQALTGLNNVLCNINNGAYFSDHAADLACAVCHHCASKEGCLGVVVVRPCAGESLAALLAGAVDARCGLGARFFHSSCPKDVMDGLRAVDGSEARRLAQSCSANLSCAALSRTLGYFRKVYTALHVRTALEYTSEVRRQNNALVARSKHILKELFCAQPAASGRAAERSIEAFGSCIRLLYDLELHVAPIVEHMQNPASPSCSYCELSDSAPILPHAVIRWQGISDISQFAEDMLLEKFKRQLCAASVRQLCELHRSIGDARALVERVWPSNVHTGLLDAMGGWIEDTSTSIRRLITPHVEQLQRAIDHYHGVDGSVLSTQHVEQAAASVKFLAHEGVLAPLVTPDEDGALACPVAAMVHVHTNALLEPITDKLRCLADAMEEDSRSRWPLDIVLPFHVLVVWPMCARGHDPASRKCRVPRLLDHDRPLSPDDAAELLGVLDTWGEFPQPPDDWVVVLCAIRAKVNAVKARMMQAMFAVVGDESSNDLLCSFHSACRVEELVKTTPRRVLAELEPDAGKMLLKAKCRVELEISRMRHKPLLEMDRDMIVYGMACQRFALSDDAMSSLSELRSKLSDAVRAPVTVEEGESLTRLCSRLGLLFHIGDVLDADDFPEGGDLKPLLLSQGTEVVDCLKKNASTLLGDYRRAVADDRLGSALSLRMTAEDNLRMLDQYNLPSPRLGTLIGLDAYLRTLQELISADTTPDTIALELRKSADGDNSSLILLRRCVNDLCTIGLLNDRANPYTTLITHVEAHLEQVQRMNSALLTSVLAQLHEQQSDLWSRLGAMQRIELEGRCNDNDVQIVKSASAHVVRVHLEERPEYFRTRVADRDEAVLRWVDPSGGLVAECASRFRSYADRSESIVGELFECLDRREVKRFLQVSIRAFEEEQWVAPPVLRSCMLDYSATLCQWLRPTDTEALVEFMVSEFVAPPRPGDAHPLLRSFYASCHSAVLNEALRRWRQTDSAAPLYQKLEDACSRVQGLVTPEASSPTAGRVAQDDLLSKAQLLRLLHLTTVADYSVLAPDIVTMIKQSANPEGDAHEVLTAAVANVRGPVRPRPAPAASLLVLVKLIIQEEPEAVEHLIVFVEQLERLQQR